MDAPLDLDGLLRDDVKAIVEDIIFENLSRFSDDSKKYVDELLDFITQVFTEEIANQRNVMTARTTGAADVVSIRAGILKLEANEVKALDMVKKNPDYYFGHISDLRDHLKKTPKA